MFFDLFIFYFAKALSDVLLFGFKLCDWLLNYLDI